MKEEKVAIAVERQATSLGLDKCTLLNALYDLVSELKEDSSPIMDILWRALHGAISKVKKLWACPKRV